MDHDGVPNDSAYRPAMPCDVHPSPRRTFPNRPLGQWHSWRRGAMSLELTGGAPALLNGLGTPTALCMHHLVCGPPKLPFSLLRSKHGSLRSTRGLAPASPLNNKTPTVTTDRLVCAPPCECTALCVDRLVCAPPCVWTALCVHRQTFPSAPPPPPYPWYPPHVHPPVPPPHVPPPPRYLQGTRGQLCAICALIWVGFTAHRPDKRGQRLIVFNLQKIQGTAKPPGAAQGTPGWPRERTGCEEDADQQVS